MPPLHSAHRPPISVPPPRPVWGPQGPAPAMLGVIPEAPARPGSAGGSWPPSTPSAPVLPQATTFQRNRPSMCSTQHPATPFLPGPRPSGWTAPQVRGRASGDPGEAGGQPGAEPRRLSTAPPAGPAAYMLPMVMGPHTVGKASQPSYSIKGRSKLGGFSDDLHKARGARGGCLTPPPGPPPEAPHRFTPWVLATCLGHIRGRRRAERRRGPWALCWQEAGRTP